MSIYTVYFYIFIKWLVQLCYASMSIPSDVTAIRDISALRVPSTWLWRHSHFPSFFVSTWRLPWCLRLHSEPCGYPALNTFSSTNSRYECVDSVSCHLALAVAGWFLIRGAGPLCGFEKVLWQIKVDRAASWLSVSDASEASKCVIVGLNVQSIQSWFVPRIIIAL